MANMLNSAKQAKKCATEILSQTEAYVNGIDENGKKILYILIKNLEKSIDGINRAIGEIDNVLPQYEDTPNKSEMQGLLQKLLERLEIMKSYSR